MLLHHYKVLAAIYPDIKEWSKFVLLNTKSNTTNLLFWGKNLWRIEENEIICFFVQLWRFLHKKYYQIEYTVVTIDDQKPRPYEWYIKVLSQPSTKGGRSDQGSNLANNKTGQNLGEEGEKTVSEAHNMQTKTLLLLLCLFFFLFIFLFCHQQHIEIRILDL